MRVPNSGRTNFVAKGLELRILGPIKLHTDPFHMEADEPADSTSAACFSDASGDEGFSECHDDSDSDGGRAPARGSEDEEIFSDSASEERAAVPLPAKKNSKRYKPRAQGNSSGIRSSTFSEAPVCKWALQKLYGIGDSTAQKLRQGTWEARWLSLRC